MNKLGVMDWIENEIQDYGIFFLLYSGGVTILLLLFMFELLQFGGRTGEFFGIILMTGWFMFWLIRYYRWRKWKLTEVE